MTAPLTLHLIRHGAPLQSGLLLGHQDMPSTPEGEAQCCAKARAAQWDELIASDLARCAMPAQMLAAERGIKFHLDARWRELDFGAWDGLHPADVPPQDLEHFWADPEANPPPKGEALSAFHKRIAAALSDALVGREDGRLLIITHGGAIRAALHLLLGWSHSQCWSLHIGYAAQLSFHLWPATSPTPLPWQGQLQALLP